jgi:hypothetical protein
MLKLKYFGTINGLKNILNIYIFCKLIKTHNIVFQYYNHFNHIIIILKYKIVIWLLIY